jgi:drug/metabolite transporter (DMT)-like permease
VVAASFIFVVSFGLASAFAQLLANTSRVIIINYSMPVWATLMAYFVLHERIDIRAAIGLALCIAGLGVLVLPAASASVQEPVGLLLALCCALAWGSGTVYMKWAQIKGDLLAITFWEIVIGLIAFSIFSLIFDGTPTFAALHARTWVALFYVGVFGTGFAFFIWFNVIGRLSTATASLGSLMNPVVGVIGAIILLGDRPTATDMIGFALIFGAAACVLIPRRVRPPVRA